MMHTPNNQAQNYQAQLDIMITAAQKAGEMARTFQEEGFERLEDKTSGDPFLTQADIALDTYLKETLTQAFPAYGWLSEETQTDTNSLNHDFCWVVDPIDGTQGFINGESAFSVSVGLVHKGVPVAGVVYAPMEYQLIAGAQGLGVFLNGIALPQGRTLSPQEQILVSMGETKSGLWAEHSNHLNIKPVGSVAYKIALVAAGKADAIISLKPKNLHDVCAGHSLILAAGGQIRDLSGQEIPYTNPSHLLTGLVATGVSGFSDDLFGYLHQCKSQTG